MRGPSLGLTEPHLAGIDSTSLLLSDLMRVMGDDGSAAQFLPLTIWKGILSLGKVTSSKQQADMETGTLLRKVLCKIRFRASISELNIKV